MSDITSNEQKLSTQLAQLSTLESLLVAEKETLQSNNPEALTALSEEKNELLLAIQQLDQTIEQSPTFKQEKQQGMHDAQLAEIKAKLTHCKELNTINGQIIAQSKLAVERMKTSLLQSHSKSSMTYDSKGKTSGGLKSLGIKA